MTIERTNIGIFGKMNSGKSTLMNLISQADTSIVDPTPGTTADTRTCLMELHGLGPVRLFDTAGLDEKGVLGGKKRKKVLEAMKESNLVLIIVDPDSKDFSTEEYLLAEARKLDKQILFILNVFKGSSEIERSLPVARFYKQLTIKATDATCRQKVIDLILNNYDNEKEEIELLPFVEKGEYYVLNIPMDAETPKGRYLRPQAMVEEYITRKWAFPVSFRMDLARARGREASQEKERFETFLANFKKRPRCIITDSQAMDIMKSFTPKDIQLTTFSIVMINYFSRGRLKLFVEGLKAVDSLRAGDKVLIAEACNHSRIGEDIGTKQIPRLIAERFKGVEVVHSFGKEYIEGDYKLAIHCGGCMLSPQKMTARIRDLVNAGVPFTNYGLFLSYMQGKQALQKVLEPWGLKTGD